MEPQRVWECWSCAACDRGGDCMRYGGGLFIGLSTLFVWYASLYYAQVIVGALVGQWLMGRTSELWPLIGRMAVGVVIVRLSTTIPVIAAG